jgi:hypothetical protein
MNQLAAAHDPGFYLYCFTRPQAVGASTSAEALVLQDVAVIFARVPLAEWVGPAAEACLQDTGWLVPRALAHEQVIESYLAEAPVLPVRFGAVFSGQAALVEFVTPRLDEISAFLDRMHGYQEWALKGILDCDRAGEWLTSTDPELAERLRSLPERPGIRYFQEKRLKADLQKRARQWGCSLAATLAAELEPCAVEVQPLRGRALAEPNQELIFHAAFLLSQAAVGDFQTQVQRLQERHALQGLTLETSGPWPPYSFCPQLAEAPA